MMVSISIELNFFPKTQGKVKSADLGLIIDPLEADHFFFFFFFLSHLCVENKITKLQWALHIPGASGLKIQ